MTVLHTLSILSTSFMRNAFQQSLKETPTYACWLLFLPSAVQLIPKHLNWVEFGWLWRPVHLMHLTLLLGASTPALLAVWGFRLGFCTALWDISWCKKGYINKCYLIWFGQLALTQPGGVLGHCPVEWQIRIPRSANQMGRRIATECCGSHAGYMCIEF